MLKDASLHGSYLVGWFFLKVFVPRFRKFSYMTRHIATLNMNEEDAKGDYVRHIAEVKDHVPADKVMCKLLSLVGVGVSESGSRK